MAYKLTLQPLPANWFTKASGSKVAIVLKEFCPAETRRFALWLQTCLNDLKVGFPTEDFIFMSEDRVPRPRRNQYDGDFEIHSYSPDGEYLGKSIFTEYRPRPRVEVMIVDSISEYLLVDLTDVENVKEILRKYHYIE